MTIIYYCHLLQSKCASIVHFCRKWSVVFNPRTQRYLDDVRRQWEGMGLKYPLHKYTVTLLIFELLQILT